MSFSALEKQAMEIALQQAGLGQGKVHPNPLVGAVLIKDEQIIGQAYHTRFGAAHAEARLLQDLPLEQTRGATLVVNLEPCNHQGKTPPCVQQIVERGIARVVIATADPNPQVDGGGAEFLRGQGIEVACGLQAEEAVRLNRGFFTRSRTGRPWVTLKIARTIDDCITPAGATTGRITGAEAERDTHRLRAEHDAILVGINTVLNDNPHLNVRYLPEDAEYVPQPVKVVLDQGLKIPESANIVRQAAQEPLRVLTREDSLLLPEAEILIEQGVQLFPVEVIGDRLHPAAVLQLLAAQGINSLLIEGGAGVYHSYVERGLFDELVVYTGSWLAGGGLRLPALDQHRELELVESARLGNDIRAVYSSPELLQAQLEFVRKQEESCSPV